MNFQFTHPEFLLLLLPAVGWVVWLFLKSDVQINPWRRWSAMLLRLIITVALIFAIAGFQWLRPQEGMNVFYLVDRSDSVPSPQQEMAVDYINRTAAQKQKADKAGVLVFGTDAAIEFTPNPVVDVQKINAVVGTERTDLSAAIRLGTAAFPETGQKRLVLLSDGNENIGDAMGALLTALPLDVTLDVVPLATARARDVSVQKLGMPAKVKKGQPFEARIFVNADEAQRGTLKLFRNDQFLGEQPVELAKGKNLFTFPQQLEGSGFYKYNVQLEAPGDVLPQNNRATAFTDVRAEPRVLLVTSSPEQDNLLVTALRQSNLDITVEQVSAMTDTLAEMQSYDSIFLSNVSAGDLGMDRMRLLESAVRDFGVGLVCIGGDNAYTAGAYKNTPMDKLLPVSSEISSKKVLPSGALVIVAHGTEFPGANQWGRDIAFAALQALGPQDEMGIVLWDGSDRWLFELAKVGDKREPGRAIAGMNQGDMPSFVNVMTMAHEALRKSTANLKHMIVFSDGDANAPSQQLMEAIVGDRITVSTVMIGGHVMPDRMLWMADIGNGRFYDVRAPGDLPQIFVKETAIILKSAIVEEPFTPQFVQNSELVRGLGATYPILRGVVVTESKPRAEMPLVTEKGDPLLAHWQYGLGRVAGFTSDARSKWAADWVGWANYRQFWAQMANWSLRRLENADLTTEISIEQGRGSLSVEALDSEGNFRNFLTLRAAVVSPKGERQDVYLEQTGPGRYEAKFDTREVGEYMLNLMDVEGGEVRGSMALGASVNYSPEFNSASANMFLLKRLAETGAGRLLDPVNTAVNPFNWNRQKTFQPRDLWEFLIKLAIVLFVLDVAIRRIQLGREELERAWAWTTDKVLFWKPKKGAVESDQSLAALLARRDKVRSSRPSPVVAPSEELFKPQ
ncbi:MAG TPA: hypothetical protein DCY13_15290, partial [Verrucomicrobiales bacterium]|nr:hypothetical protein [Verrucomicrobiales bacterium]